MTSVETNEGIDSLTNPSVDLTRRLISAAQAKRTSHERAKRKRFARMVAHSDASKFTMMLTDRVIRINSNRNAARALTDVGELASAPGLGVLDFTLIRIAILASKFFPNLVMQCVRWRVRKAAVGIILPAESDQLAGHIHTRSKTNIKLNVNVLGEAILGEHEAHDRLLAVLEMMQRPEIDYVSVKISALVSQINALDHLGSVERVALPLREIYRSSNRNNTFVNLDMEEFKDLKITVDVFTKLLDEPEFENLSAGIVLQAYLPDSHAEMQNLIGWATKRFERTGVPIKIRIVKGANLAQELTDAQLHGWPTATYATKALVDASYLRMLDQLLRPENSSAVRVGIASHNLFHLAWAICVAEQRGVVSQIDIEMLEGMANSEAQAISEIFGSVLLYSPVTYKSDFPSAVAYLVRRLDENTSPENYLSASFNISATGSEFESQMSKFVKAVSARHNISTTSLRHQTINDNSKSGFENASDGDPTNPDFQRTVYDALEIVTKKPEFHIPLGIDVPSESKDVEIGVDPNANGAKWYTYNVATTADVDNAVSSAVASLGRWENRGSDERAQLLQAAAEQISSQRAELIALMARDGGKSPMEADAEISEAIDFANYYAEQAKKLVDGSQSIGPVLVIPPWNFPFAIPMGGVCAALAAGNTVILKPAPETVAIAKALVDILWQAGIPSDVLQFLPCRDDEIGQYLVTHEGISAVILTGSFETAKLFKSWKPDLNLLAETSGKNSIVVTACADIDSAVKDLVTSAFGHAGQKCSAASLAIVDESLYANDTFLSQLRDAAHSLAFGPSTNIGTTNGP
ncbi:MAG: proline dehydrogenase family protein, partial [Actinobacteria bacterium]|nr:proline dehydrogenase family protein [Actinomycetota bacterium]